MSTPRRAVAIIPCNDLSVSQHFYELLGFVPDKNAGGHDDYIMLADPGGAEIHLSQAPDGWLTPGRSPFGLYLYADNVEALADRLGARLLHPPCHQPWGMFEFAVSDPDGNLVRVGRPAAPG